MLIEGGGLGPILKHLWVVCTRTFQWKFRILSYGRPTRSTFDVRQRTEEALDRKLLACVLTLHPYFGTWHMRNILLNHLPILFNLNSGYIIWFERKNCLTIVSTIQKKKHSHAPVSHERSLYDINVYTPNYSPEQRFEPGKISSTNGRSDRRCE